MHFNAPACCGWLWCDTLNVALFWFADQLCTTKQFVGHLFENMTDKSVCGSSVNHKFNCVSKNGKYESQIQYGFLENHSRRFTVKQIGRSAEWQSKRNHE